MRLAVRPGAHVLADVAIEDREDVAGELLGAEAVHGRQHLEPLLRAHLRRVLGDERADLGQRLLRRDREARADVLGGGLPGPQLTRDAVQMVPGELGVAAAEGRHAAHEVSEVLGVGLALQRLGERLDGVVLLRREQDANLRDDGVLEAAAARQRADEHLAVGALVSRLGGGRRGHRPVRLLLARGEHGAADDVRHFAAGPAVAPGESAGGTRHGDQGSRMTCSLAFCSRRKPSRPSKYSSTAARQPDQWS